MWLVSVRLLTKLIDFAVLLILARLLSPSDFGLVAIGMTLILVVEAVLELPINQALVRQAAITSAQLNTAFTLGVLRGFALAAVLMLLAYPFSLLYGDHRLIPILLALGCAPILRGMQSPRLAVFARQIDFRRDFIIDLAGKLTSFSIAIAIAWRTHSYWALVLGTVSTPLAMVMTSYAVAPFRPRFTLREWPLFAEFVGWSTITQLLSAVSWQSDKLILGHFTSPRSLGVFTLANDLAYIPELALIKPIMRPLMAAFSHVRDAPDRLRDAYERASHTLLAIGAPVMLGLCLLADPIVRLMLGGKWLAAVPILQWLPLSLIPPLLSAPFWSLTMALGRPRVFTWQTFVDLLLRGGLLLVGAITGGVSGVVIARIAASVLSAGSAAWCVKLLTGVSVARQFLATWRIVTAGLAMASTVGLLRPITDGQSGLGLAAMLGLVVAVGGLIYTATLIATWKLAGSPAGFESWCFAYVQRRLRRQQASPTVYVLVLEDQWQRWQTAGQIFATSDGDRPLYLMTAADILTAASRLTSALDQFILVQIKLNSVPGAPGKGRRTGVACLPMSAVCQSYHLKDLRSQ